MNVTPQWTTKMWLRELVLYKSNRAWNPLCNIHPKHEYAVEAGGFTGKEKPHCQGRQGSLTCYCLIVLLPRVGVA